MRRTRAAEAGRRSAETTRPNFSPRPPARREKTILWREIRAKECAVLPVPLHQAPELLGVSQGSEWTVDGANNLAQKDLGSGPLQTIAPLRSAQAPIYPVTRGSFRPRYSPCAYGIHTRMALAWRLAQA